MKMKKKPYIPPRIECLTDHLVFLDCTVGFGASGECSMGSGPSGGGGANCCDGSSATACASGSAPG